MRSRAFRATVLGVAFTAALAPAFVPAFAQSGVPDVPARATHTGRAEKTHPAPIVRPPALTPLTERERAVQMLDRFTYGPRPGEVDRVLATGANRWFEQQLLPGTIPDATLNKRLADLPTLAMTPPQALAVFPDRGQVQAVAQGKAPMPADPLERSVFEVQVAKWQAEQDRKKADGSTQPAPEPTDAEKAAQKKVDQATAARIAGELFALPREQRMAALMAMPVPDRIAFTANGNLQGQQRTLLLADFTPRERETFQAMSGQVSSSGNLANELAQGHLLRDILSERQLETVMTDFWFNHFNVFIGKDSDQWYTTSYERDVIRPRALGRFRDLLLATATAPAMMVYLDNWLSIGPDSIANGVNPANPKARRGSKGLNENYGREVMELHTVGVNGGYSQADVMALAAILTGWGVDKPGEGGPFLFDPKRHEPGAKVWFGDEIFDDGHLARLPAGAQAKAIFEPGDAAATGESMKQGIAALNALAASSQCARYIATKLAEYFVADTPPPALVERLTSTYLANDGDIRAMLRTIVASPEFNSRQYFRTKVKTPVEFLASAFRATSTDPQNLGALVNEAKTMGMPLYYALAPTGYYLSADQWMNSTALVDRLNFAYQLTSGKLPNQRFDSPKLLAMGLLTSGGNPNAGHPGSPSPISANTPANRSAALRGVSAEDRPPVAADAVGTGLGPRVASEVLEVTMIGAPVSAKTQALLEDQVAQQPPNTNAGDTLNLLTGLLLGSPEFQRR